jgi:predicted DNA-binding transcriptional regulator YafY
MRPSMPEKKISFLYFKYDVRKEPKLRNDGKPWIFSPHKLVWNGDFYYMVGVFDSKRVGTFRLDRILKRPDILEEDALPFPADFDFEKHLQTSFRMFGTKYTTVDLICSNDLMDAILDKFGKDVTTYCYDMENFRAEVDVVPSSVFYSWVFGFGGDVVINGPADVKEEFKQLVQKVADKLNA